MQITGTNNVRLVLGSMLMLVVVQLFSIHLHFEHTGQTHDVHVHSSLMLNHDLIVDGSSDPGEEDEFDFVGWSGKKLSPLYLLIIFFHMPTLRCLIQPGLLKPVVHRTHKLYRYFFFPHLRAPPLRS